MERSFTGQIYNTKTMHIQFNQKIGLEPANQITESNYHNVYAIKNNEKMFFLKKENKGYIFRSISNDGINGHHAIPQLAIFRALDNKSIKVFLNASEAPQHYFIKKMKEETINTLSEITIKYRTNLSKIHRFNILGQIRCTLRFFKEKKKLLENNINLKR